MKMAGKNLFFSILVLLFSLFLYLPSTLSHPTTALFDVSASLLRTHHVTSKILNPAQSQKTTPSLSLTLHPRSSLHKPQFNDYESLTRSRLARNSARINSILSHLKRTLTGANATSSVLNPKGFKMPITSGLSLGAGEYFARLAVGNPPREYYLIADTGSDVVWLQCSPCSICYPQSDPIFDPYGSSTFRLLSCDSPQCRQLPVAGDLSGCQAGSCLYGVSYGDGSVSLGTFATETLTFGNSRTAIEVAIGCGHNNQGVLNGSAGLLGLGGGPLSLPSQLNATSFSYCLVDLDSSGSSTLEFNSGRPRDSITTPLIQNPLFRAYRYVAFSGFVVEGRKVRIPSSVFAIDKTGNGGVVVDSGSTITTLPTEAYNPLRDAFVSMARHLPRADRDASFDTCYDLSGKNTGSVPTLGFLFPGSKVLHLPQKNYLIQVNDQGKYCFAFTPTNESMSIIGNVQQQGIRISYDLGNSIVGFSPDKC